MSEFVNFCCLVINIFFSEFSCRFPISWIIRHPHFITMFGKIGRIFGEAGYISFITMKINNNTFWH